MRFWLHNPEFPVICFSRDLKTKKGVTLNQLIKTSLPACYLFVLSHNKFHFSIKICQVCSQDRTVNSKRQKSTENSTCPFPHRIGIASLGPNNPGRDLQNDTTQMAAAFEGTGIQKNGINTFILKKKNSFLALEVLGFKFKPGGLGVALSGRWNVPFVGKHEPVEHEKF